MRFRSLLKNFVFRSRPPTEHSGVASPNLGGEPLCSLVVLSDGSKRLPGVAEHGTITQVPPSKSEPLEGIMVNSRDAGQFSGAACCRLAEQPNYKAAPLQALGRLSAIALDLPPSRRLPRSEIQSAAFGFPFAHTESYCDAASYSNTNAHSITGGDHSVFT